jgi:hypothetical protein
MRSSPTTQPAPMIKARQIVVAGAVLIGGGIFASVRQALTAAPNPEFGGLARWGAGTEFPGLFMICAGAFLLCVVAVMRR